MCQHEGLISKNINQYFIFIKTNIHDIQLKFALEWQPLNWSHMNSQQNKNIAASHFDNFLTHSNFFK